MCVFICWLSNYAGSLAVGSCSCVGARFRTLCSAGYYVIGTILVVLSALITIYHDQIVDWLKPAATWMKEYVHIPSCVLIVYRLMGPQFACRIPNSYRDSLRNFVSSSAYIVLTVPRSVEAAVVAVVPVCGPRTSSSHPLSYRAARPSLVVHFPRIDVLHQTSRRVPKLWSPSSRATYLLPSNLWSMRTAHLVL